jgi:hypothetical protein
MNVMDDYFSVLASILPPLEIEILMAFDAEGDSKLKHHGHACAATIKILKPEDRAASRHDGVDPGVPDVRLVLDRERWIGLEERQKTALIHHELCHLVPVRRKDKSFKRDSFDRVKLKNRLDSWLLTGFLETAQIFGDDALEVISLNAVSKVLKSASKGLPFGEPEKAEKAGKSAKDTKDKPSKPPKPPRPKPSKPAATADESSTPSGPVLAESTTASSSDEEAA